jgi:Mg-chelatase subunit ChlD
MYWRSFAFFALSLAACAESRRAPESSAPSESMPDESASSEETAVAPQGSPDAQAAPSTTVITTVPPPSPATRPEPESRGILLFASASVGAEDAGSATADAGVTISEPTSVLVVLDQSGSMGTGWSGGDSRWVAANKALIGALGPPREQLTIGAILFPLPGACEVTPITGEGQFPFQPGPAFIETWKQTIRVHDPNGSTPLERALAAADAALTEAESLLQRRSMVLVITDGEPTCDDDPEAFERYPAAWLARGIPTHVMGLPGSGAAAELLDRVARAGGTGQHTQIGTPDQLQTGVAALLASRRFGL